MGIQTITEATEALFMRVESVNHLFVDVSEVYLQMFISLIGFDVYLCDSEFRLYKIKINTSNLNSRIIQIIKNKMYRNKTTSGDQQ